MIPPLGVGLALHPNAEYLEAMEPMLARAEFFEVAPEVTWGIDAEGRIGFARMAQVVDDLQARHGVPLVAHGLGLSPGSVSNHPADAELNQQWWSLVEQAQRRWGFLWYLDHQGFCRHSGRQAVLPLPLHDHPAVVGAVHHWTSRLSRINPFPGFENSAWYFTLANPVDEGQLYRKLLGTSGWLLLDIHNLYTHCRNFNTDWRPYIEQLPLDRVLCAHISGGSESDAEWLKSGTTRWLDGHDGPTPEAVWSMAESILPRCGNLRGIVWERMEGTFETSDIPLLEAEYERTRQLWQSLDVAAEVQPLPSVPAPAVYDEEIAAQQCRIVEALYQKSPTLDLPWVDRDDLEISSLIIHKLRFERLVRGDPEIAELYDNSPDEFVARFEAYNDAVLPNMYFPAAEARAWHGFFG